MSPAVQYDTPRRYARVRVAVPVQIIAAELLQPTCTLDVSRRGARICNLHVRPMPEDFVVLERGDVRSSYRVVWSGDEPGQASWQAGLECLDPEYRLFQSIQA